MNTITTTTTTATTRGSIENDERKSSIDFENHKIGQFCETQWLSSLNWFSSTICFFVLHLWSTYRSSDNQIIESTSKILLNNYSILLAIGFAVNHFDDIIDGVKWLRMRIFHSKKKSVSEFYDCNIQISSTLPYILLAVVVFFCWKKSKLRAPTHEHRLSNNGFSWRWNRMRKRRKNENKNKSKRVRENMPRVVGVWCVDKRIENTS